MNRCHRAITYHNRVLIVEKDYQTIDPSSSQVITPIKPSNCQEAIESQTIEPSRQSCHRDNLGIAQIKSSYRQIDQAITKSHRHNKMPTPIWRIKPGTPASIPATKTTRIAHQLPKEILTRTNNPTKFPPKETVEQQL